MPYETHRKTCENKDMMKYGITSYKKFDKIKKS